MAVNHTEQARRRYDRLAPYYDLMSRFMRRLAEPYRKRMWSSASGRILELGVGTGESFPFYPQGADAIAVDFSAAMLEYARRRSETINLKVDLRQADVQELPFEDGYFDTAIGTFLFCSVPDPVKGLQEVRRVLKPGGTLLLLEHVRINHPVIGRLMDLMNPLAYRIMGANINRETVHNVERAGLKITGLESAGAYDFVKFIEAEP